MADTEGIRRAFERNAKAVSLRPSIGQGTAVTRVRVKEGLTCEIEDGTWKLTADLTEKSGGKNAGPNPGVLGRSALGSCLAISYAQWAARRGVPLESIEVEVHADYDTRGMYGVSDEMKPGYAAVRYVVSVISDAPEDDVVRVLDEADAHCVYLDVFRRPYDTTRELRLRASTA